MPSHIVTCYECSVVIPGDACCFLRGQGGGFNLGGEETERKLEGVERGESLIRKEVIYERIINERKKM